MHLEDGSALVIRASIASVRLQAQRERPQVTIVT